MPECIGVFSVFTLTTTLHRPRSVVVSVGWPTAKLPVSQTRMASARSRSGFCGDELLQLVQALLLRALRDELQTDRIVAAAQRPQGREVHDDVALAVGGAAAVPAPVALRQFEDRRTPGGLVHRRLDVVVAVQQHRRCAGRCGILAEDGRVALWHIDEADVLEAKAREGVGDVLRGLQALLDRVAASGRRPT